MMRLIKIAWVLLCVGVLAYYMFDRSKFEIDFLVMIDMIVLSFPIGWVAAIASGWLFFGLDSLLGHTGSREEGTVVFWFIALVLGYWQWFVLLPHLIKRFKARRRNDAV
jgi:hypothetical protein